MEAITLARAREMIERVKNTETGSKLFDRSTDSAEFCQRLADGGFTSDEIVVIMAGLRLAYAKFKK